MEHAGTPRHLDTGKWLLGWADEIEVLCPRCGEPGVLRGDAHYQRWGGCFVCLACSYQARSDTTGWVGAVEARGRRRCGDCGSRWVYVAKTFSSEREARSELVGTCQFCGKHIPIPVDVFPDKPQDQSVDPFLGLNLALKENTRHGVVWVYNARHLAELKLFIEARVREDFNYARSYFSRLPTWIKSAKNRDEVLKAIERLGRRTRTSANTAAPQDV